MMTHRTNSLARYTKVRTKDNTEFVKWWKLYNKALAVLGLPEASEMDAMGAYEVGHSPETAADYEAGSR